MKNLYLNNFFGNEDNKKLIKEFVKEKRFKIYVWYKIKYYTYRLYYWCSINMEKIKNILENLINIFV